MSEDTHPIQYINLIGLFFLFFFTFEMRNTVQNNDSITYESLTQIKDLKELVHAQHQYITALQNKIGGDSLNPESDNQFAFNIHVKNML